MKYNYFFRILLLLPFLILNSCNEDLSQKWIETIFKCDTQKYCIPKMQDVCTTNFTNYRLEAMPIFGASNLTNEEREIEEIAFVKKWKNLYSTDLVEENFFGEPNGDSYVKAVEIKNIDKNDRYSNYEVKITFSDFQDESTNITISKVKVIKYGNSFLIDDCKTEYPE
jgi:hypothetical protein